MGYSLPPLNPAQTDALARMERAMKAELSADLGVCSAYEELLRDCEQALEDWSARSEQIRQIHLTGIEVGSELLLLQARFAKAYAVLRKHTQKCPHCSFLARRNDPRGFRRSSARREPWPAHIQ